MNSALFKPSSSTAPETVSPECHQAPGQREDTTSPISGYKVTFTISIFKQVVRVDHQVGIFLIALTFFGGAFQSGLGKLNQNMIVVR